MAMLFKSIAVSGPCDSPEFEKKGPRTADPFPSFLAFPPVNQSNFLGLVREEITWAIAKEKG